MRAVFATTITLLMLAVGSSFSQYSYSNSSDAFSLDSASLDTRLNPQSSDLSSFSSTSANDPAASFDATGIINPANFLPVEEAYKLFSQLEPDGSIRLYWEIANAYYLYQHAFKFTLKDATGQDIPLQFEYPQGKTHTDDYFGTVEVYYQQADITLQPEQQVESASLSVRYQGCADAGLCYPPEFASFDIDFASAEVTKLAQVNPLAIQASANSSSSTSGEGVSLITALLFAFFGGMILNLMPCVFPVLSLKIVSFSQHSNHDNHLHSWIYTAGVVVSFVAVAIALIALQQAGQAVGWGFQLQSPGFLIALVYLFIAMGLALSGVVEFGEKMMGMGSNLADQGGMKGSFFTGVLAVIVASPCTAPFMGTALGYAITQPEPIALLIFAVLGLGMATPLVLLSYSKLLRKNMPKPGAWMESFKQFMAFPLYATAIWLLWVVGRQQGVNTMAIALVGGLLLAMALWFWQRSKIPASITQKILAALCLVAAISLPVSYSPPAETATNKLTGNKVAWSEQALQQALAAGQPVFVDVTADWCITCIANEKAVLETEEMQALFEQNNVLYMVADWTNYDADISAYLARYNRIGIPFYALYPGEAAATPEILPQILTDDIVGGAIAKVSPSP